MVDIVMLCKCKLPNLQIVKLRSLDIIKVSIPCNVMYFAASLSMRPSGSMSTVSRESDLRNDVF